MTTGGQNDWREGGLSKKRKKFQSHNICQYFRYLYGLVKEKKVKGLIFYFWVFNGTIHMRELHTNLIFDTSIIVFLDKLSLFG